MGRLRNCKPFKGDNFKHFLKPLLDFLVFYIKRDVTEIKLTFLNKLF